MVEAKLRERGKREERGGVRSEEEESGGVRRGEDWRGEERERVGEAGEEVGGWFNPSRNFLIP